MPIRIDVLLGALILVPALAGGASAADAAKIQPHLKAPGAKTGCPSASMDSLNGKVKHPRLKRPGKHKGGRRLHPGEMRQLNPQPEPPSNPRTLKRLRPGEERELNPQPLPPRAPKAGTVKPQNPGALKGFNPQPEIPGKGRALPPNPCQGAGH